jgi:hypothetical protein
MSVWPFIVLESNIILANTIRNYTISLGSTLLYTETTSSPVLGRISSSSFLRFLRLLLFLWNSQRMAITDIPVLVLCSFFVPQLD